MQQKQKVVSSTPSQAIIVKNLLKHDCNRKCADCNSTSVTWAVLNFGAVVCADCASIHRSFGTHISVVKSLSLDIWKPEYMLIMKHASNAKHNAKYESGISDFSKPKPEAHRSVKDRYLKDKYVNKLWYNEHGKEQHEEKNDEKEKKPLISVKKPSELVVPSNIENKKRVLVKKSNKSSNSSSVLQVKKEEQAHQNLLLLEDEPSSKVVKNSAEEVLSVILSNNEGEKIAPPPQPQEKSLPVPVQIIPASIFEFSQATASVPVLQSAQESKKKNILAMFETLPQVKQDQQQFHLVKSILTTPSVGIPVVRNVGNNNFYNQNMNCFFPCVSYKVQ